MPYPVRYPADSEHILDLIDDLDLDTAVGQVPTGVHCIEGLLQRICVAH
jgi:hypothetical protein